MTMENPIISFIIAAHNCANTLEATIQSLLDAAGSSLERIEIIIVNDASTDNTAEIIHCWMQRIPQLIVSKVEFKNVGKVRQHGIMLSHGKYITMLDSDDLLKKGSLPPILGFLQQTKPDMLLTRLHEIREISQIDHQWSGLRPQKISQHTVIKRFLIHKDLQAHLIGQFIRRDIYIAHPIPPMSCYEDFYVFPSMLIDAKNIYFQYDSHYYYIKRSDSLSTTLNGEKIANLVTCTENMENTFPKKFQKLILCHWLDIYLKHAQLLSNKQQKDKVEQCIRMTHRLAFFLSPSIRLSYKRKALSTLWKS